MMYREQINGVPKIEPGFVLPERHETFEDAFMLMELLKATAHKFTPGKKSYEITGTAGNYQIIERRTTPEPSDYIKRK